MNRVLLGALAAPCLSISFLAACAASQPKPPQAAPASEPVAVFDFEAPSQLASCYVNERFAYSTSEDPIAGGASLLIDTRLSQTDWTQCLKTPSGLLKGGRDYVVEFKCKNVFVGPDSYSLFLVRPFDADNGFSDLTELKYDSLGPSRVFKISFHVPKGRDDYSFQIHSRKKVAALVDDIKIMQGVPGSFIPANADRSPSSALNLPTGCPEFEIDLPNLKDAREVSVVDFGASPSLPDNSKAFAAAIARCKDSGASKLAIPTGVYRFLGDEPLRFEGLSDFELDGRGSSFVFFRKRGSLIEISKCARARFKDFSIDWDWDKDPIGSVVRVEAVEPSGEYADFRFVDYETFPQREVRFAAFEEYDKENERLSTRSDSKRCLFFTDPVKPTFKWLSGNLLRVFPEKNYTRGFFAKSLKEGSYFRFQHYYYEMPGVAMKANAHLTLSGVTLYSSPGHAFVVGGEQSHWQLVNSKIMRPPGSKRPLSCSADHCHVGQSLGYMKMIGCDFSYGCDDFLNVHDCSIFASKSGGSVLTTRNTPHYVMASVRPGDPLELRADDYSPTGFSSKAKSILKKGEGVYDIVLEDPLPEQKGEGFVLFNRRYGSNHVIVRDCKFHDAIGRRLLLLAEDVTVERNSFHLSGPIKIETGYTFNVWSEGYGASNIVIRGNVLDNVNPRAGYKNELSPAIYMSVYLKSDPSTIKTSYPILRDILIEGNKFIDCPGAIAYACSAKNVIVRDNEIVNATPRYDEFTYRGGVGTAWSSDVFVTGNKWLKAPPSTKPGLYYDEETSKDVFCWGNELP